MKKINKRFGSGIHALVVKDNRYLLIKRSTYNKHDPNCRDLPGGGVELGEQPLDAIIRETKEEVDLEISPGEIVHICSIECDGGYSIEAYVKAIYVKGKVVLSNEHTESIWVTKEEIQTIQPRSIHLQKVLKYI